MDLKTEQEITAREERAAREEARGEALGRKLAAEGGDCEVIECGSPLAQFTIRLHDGRVFRGCAMHGNGGLYKADPKSVKTALARCDGASVISENGTRPVVLYTVYRWFGDQMVTVMPSEIASVVVWENPSAVREGSS